jgi:hypothetical protein
MGLHLPRQPKVDILKLDLSKGRVPLEKKIQNYV